MEPDLLASAGDPAVSSRWTQTRAVQTEDSPKVETPAEINRPRLVRLPAVTAHATVVPRTRVHAGGYSNGHARPRPMPAHWPAATPAARIADAAVLPFETPESLGPYLRGGKRALDIVSAIAGLIVFAPGLCLLP